jgi:hypothetical protein
MTSWLTAFLTAGSMMSGFAPGEPLDVVRAVHARVSPAHTVAGAFEVTKRVAWELRERGFGLLLKPGGENIVVWKEQTFSASRVCLLAEGHLFKVLTDVPTTNGPSWQDDGAVPPGQACTPAIDPEDSPTPTDPAITLADLQRQIAVLLAEQREHARADGDAHAALHDDVGAVRTADEQFQSEVRDWKKDVLLFVAKYGSVILGSLLAGRAIAQP